MSDYQDLFGMFGGTGACQPPQSGPVPPGPGPVPPGSGPIPPGPGPVLPGQGFGSGNIIIWIIILLFLFRGGFGFGGGNNSLGGGCGNTGCGNTGCGNNNLMPVVPVYETGCCTTMVQNPCSYTEYCNCCGKRVKKCKKQKNYIVEMCQCGGNLPVANESFGCGNGYGFWWIIILIILFCFRGGNGFISGAPTPLTQRQTPCEC